MDQSKKTMRHFYCRDVLWETFEQMANDFDCSIDYLINEAMRYYARSKNYQSTAMPPSQPPGMHPPQGQPQYNPPQGGGAYPPPVYPAGPTSARRPPPPPPNRPPPAARQPGLPPPGQPTGGIRPPGRGPQYDPVNATPTLYLIYNGHRYPISKDQFIIGRGSKDRKSVV